MATQYRYDKKKKTWVKVTTSTPSRGETNRNGRSSASKSGTSAKTTPAPSKPTTPSPSAPKPTPKPTTGTSSSSRTYSRGETNRSTTTSTPRYNTYDPKSKTYSYDSKNSTTGYKAIKYAPGYKHTQERDALSALQKTWDDWMEFVKGRGTEESKEQRGSLARAGMKDLDTIDTDARRKEVDEVVWQPGAKGNMDFTKFQAGKDAYKTKLWSDNVAKGIDSVEGLSAREKRKAVEAAQREAKEAGNTYAIVRARDGDLAAMNDLTGKAWTDAGRAGRMWGYDTTSEVMQQQVTEEMRKAGTTPVDIPADYGMDNFDDDRFVQLYGEHLDGSAATAQERQEAKQRLEMVTGIEDVDTVTDWSEVTFDPSYLQDLQTLNRGTETYQDMLDKTSQYGGDKIAEDMLVLRDHFEGHVPRSQDEVIRAANRVKAATGVDVLNAADMEAAFDQAVQTNDGLREAVAQAVYNETGKMPVGADFDLDDYMAYMQAYMQVQNNAMREEGEQLQFDDTIQQKYGEYLNAPDFASKSQPVSLGRAPTNEAEAIHQAIVAIDDPELFEQLVDPRTGMPSAAQQKYTADTISPEQRNMYHYIRREFGEEAAMEYLEDIDWSVRKLTARKTEDVNKQLSEGVGGGAAGSLATVLGNVGRAAVVPVNTIRNWMGQEIDQYDPTFNVGRASDAIRQNVGQNLDELLNGANIAGWNIGSGVYQGLMSVADNWMLYGLGPNAGSAIMGMEAGDTAMRNALANGRTQEEALRDAYVTAGIEGITEKMGMDKLFGDVGNPLKYVVSNALAEAGEEVSSEIMNMIYDTAMYGDDSDLGRLRAELITKGYLKGDLNWQLIKQMAGQLRDAGFGGFIGGAGGATPNATVTAISDASAGKNLQKNKAAQSLLDFAGKMLPEGDVRNMANELMGAIKEGGKVANSKLGRVYRELLGYVDEHTRQVLDGTMARNVREQLREMGVNSRELVDSVLRVVAGDGSASPMDYITVGANDAARAVAKSLTDKIDYVKGVMEKAGEFVENAGKKKPAPEAAAEGERVFNPDAEEGETESSSEEFDFYADEADADIEFEGMNLSDSEVSTTSDGEEVSVDGVESVGTDGEMKFKVTTADGTQKTVSASEVSLGTADQDTARLAAYAKEYGTDAASMFNARMPSQDVKEYAAAFGKAVQYGRDGRNIDSVSGYDSVKMLNPNQLGIAYEIGRAERSMRTEMTRQHVTEKMTANGPVKVGMVDVSQIKSVRGLNKHQRRSIVAMRNVAELLGINIEFTESAADERGRYQGAHGSWNPSTLTLSLDIHAGSDYANDLNYAMMHTAGHELTHTIYQFADAEIRDAYQDFVLSALGNKMTEDKLEARIQEYIGKPGVKNRDAAIEEIVAEASVEAFSKITESDIRQLAEENYPLVKRIANQITRWVSNMKRKIAKAFAGTEAKNEYAKMMNDQLDELAEKWNAALVNAVRNKNTQQWAAERNQTESGGERVFKADDASEATSDAAGEFDFFADVDSTVETTPTTSRRAERLAAVRARHDFFADDVAPTVDADTGAVVAPNVAEFMQSDDYSAPDNGLFGTRYSLRETEAWAKSHREQYPDDKTFEQNLALVQQFDRDVAADAVSRYLVPHGRVPKTVRGPLRNNVEYVYTFDMDTKCERTYQFLAYRDAIQKRIGRQLKEDEARCLIELMRAYGQMIPCTYCYVEGKRMKLAELYMKYLEKNGGSVMGRSYSAEEVFDIVETARSVVAGYLDDRFNTEDNYTLDATLATGSFEGYRDFNMPITEEAAADEICERYGVTDKAAKRVIAGFVAEWVYSRRMDVPQNLVNTDVDFNSAGIDERVLAFHDLASKAAQGGAKAKGIENYEPYVDQLKNVSVEDKRYMVGMGGIRKHSSNDFQIQNVQDYMLFFMDLAADKRGGVSWTGHTYTKNLDYARIFAPTNDRINVSIAMYGDAKSGIRPNTQEGVEWEELKQIRKQYKNVGAMAMVTNNDQLSFALNSDWIDMIIPFHASGMKRSLYYDVLAWTDYTSKQSERLYTKGQMIEKLRAKGVKVSSSAKAADVLKMFMENFDVKTVYNEKTGKRVAPHFFPGETEQHGVKIPGHNNDPQRYFELCEQYGTNPRFFGVKVQNAAGETIDVTQHPSYLKLIKETARTDSPQEPIVAKFDMDYVNKAMKAFKGYANLSEDPFGIVDEFVNEYAGKKRKVGDLTERAQQYKEIREEMAAEEAAKRASRRETMMENINKSNPESASESEFADDGVRYSPRFYNVEVSDSEIRDNIDDVLSMDSVIALKGDEVTFGDGDLQDTVLGYYNQIGGKAFNPTLGDVTLNNRSIKNARGHGMYPLKAIAFYAVPTVIEEGKIINYDSNWQGTGQKSYIIAAPVNVTGGRLKGEYWMGVIVLANADSQRFYTHDAVAIKKEGVEALKTGTNFEEIRFPGGNKPSLTTILQKLNSVKADARYQLRDPDRISDRELLANMMDSAAENQVELDFVRRYRSKIAELDQKQAEYEQARQDVADARKSGARKSDIAVLENKVKILGNQLDRMDGQLLKFEAGKPLQAVVKRQREELRKKASERMQKRVAEVRRQEREKYDRLDARMEELRQKKNAKIEELKREKAQKVKEVRDEKNESFAKQKYRKRLEEDIGTLRTWVTSPTNKEHVPQFMRKPLGDMIASLDFSSVRRLDGGADTQKDQKLKDALDAMNLALMQLRSQQDGLDQGAAQFATIIDLPFGYNEEFTELVAKIKTTLDATRASNDIAINRMTSAQLKALSQAIRTLTTSIRQMNRLLANAKYESAVTAANNTMDSLDKMTAKKDAFKLTEAVGKFMDWTNTVPYYAFKRFGEGGKAIFSGLMDGWDKLAFNSDRLVKFTEEAYTTKEVKKWAGEMHGIQLDSGDTVRMTTAQLMSLYCLSKRAQAVGHLMGGGIRIADIDSKGKRIVQSENYTLTQNDLQTFADTLTARQREVADKLQEFMSTQGAEWGNEISMKRFGYEMFTEAHYFPIETDSNNRRTIDEQAQENSLFRLLNMSATKGLVKGANNAIVVRDIFDVFTAHSSDMAKYNALGLQILDAMKWLNYVERTQNDDGSITTRSVQKSLERAYGTDARKYILNLLRDLNGTREGGRNDGLINKVISNAKVASVAANVRVYLLQATSMPRAAYAISPAYLTIGMAKMMANPVKAAKTAIEKVGIAKWKSMGFYDTNISGNIREMVKHDQTIPDKIREASMAPAGWFDNMTMATIYYAAEAECAKKYPNAKKGSATWDKLVNDRVRDIVYQTQVVDSTMTRSDAMRGKGIVTLATSFMSEPTLAMNMLSDAIYDARMKRRGMEDIKAPTAKMTKAIGVFTVTAVLTALMESLFDAERDDDEFETFSEKYMAALIGDLTEEDTAWQKFGKVVFSNIGSNLNVLNNIPFVSDAMSIVEGYDNSAMYSAFIDSFKSSYDAYNSWLEGKGTMYSWIYSGLKGVSQASGLPVSNAAREVTSVWNTFFAEKMGWKRIQTYPNTEREAAKAIFKAQQAGDTERVSHIRDRAGLYSMDEEKINSAIAKFAEDAYLRGDMSREAAAGIMTSDGGKRNRQAEDALVKADYQRETGLKHSDMKDDFISGVLTEAKAREYLKKYDGLRKDDIDDRILEWKYEQKTGLSYSSMKQDYLDGELTDSEVMSYRTQYGGAEKADVEETLGHWQYEKDTGLLWSELKDDYADGVISETKLRDYLKVYGGKDEEEVEEKVSNYDFQIATGRTSTAPKYWRIAHAAETGGDYGAYIDEAFQKIMYGGEKRKTQKQARSQIASSLASYYKYYYLPIAGTAEGNAMLERILDVYEAIGYSRSYEREYIAENWFE